MTYFKLNILSPKFIVSFIVRIFLCDLKHAATQHKRGTLELNQLLITNIQYRNKGKTQRTNEMTHLPKRLRSQFSALHKIMLLAELARYQVEGCMTYINGIQNY